MLFIVTISVCIIISTAISITVPEDKGSLERNCTCVPYYQCSEETGLVISDGAGLFDYRTLNTETGQCFGYFDVCCRLPNKDAKPPKDQASSNRESPKGCGYNKPGDYPWTVALLHQANKASPWVYKCGSTLINRQAVITAAHCLQQEQQQEEEEKGEERAGSWAIKIKNQIYPVKRISTHPNFERTTLKNDLAVLVLKSPVYVRHYVPRTICLPPPGTIIDSTRCMVNAWQTKENADVLANVAQETLKLPVVPRERCQSALRNTRLGVYFELDESFLCAGGEENRDACKGHGGSALICPVPNQPNRYHQVGIVSWGIGCGGNGTPGVYVNVAMFRNWIDEILIENKLDITSYRY